MLRSDDADDRQTFRPLLLQSILQAGHLGTLHAQEQQRFFELLSGISTSLRLANAAKAIDSERTRRLRKLASDSRRLMQAIQTATSSHSCDGALLDDDLQHTRPLAAMVADLDKASSVSSNLADAISKQRNNSAWLFSQSMLGSQLLGAFAEFTLPCTTRNDYDTIFRDSTLPRKRSAAQRKRNYDHLPSLDGNATLAMRCALLILFDANVDELDWSSAVALIKAGKAFNNGIEKMHQNIEKTSFELRRAVMGAIHALDSMGVPAPDPGGRLRSNKRKTNRSGT
jgi:hypothetical protein